MKALDLTGKRFGKLEVLEEAPRRVCSGRKLRYWRCRCECGTEKEIAQDHLTRKNVPVISCGCMMITYGCDHVQWNGAGRISGGWWYDHVLKNCSRKKLSGLVHNATKQYVWDLFVSQKGLCAITGLPLSLPGPGIRNATASLDRIDSSKGYCVGNVQWVHKDINRMKSDFAQDYFIEMCVAVAHAVSKGAVDCAGGVCEL